MTKRTSGASASVTESYGTLFDGNRQDVGTAALPITADLTMECFQVIVQNDVANANNLRVGSATSQSILLAPGQSETIPYRGRISDIYVRFVAGANQRVNWHAMR